MDLSVIIINYNVKFFLEQCLESLFQSFVSSEEVEVFVVDNASTDGSEEYILSRFKDERLRWLANKENVGFGRANNQAVSLAEGKYLLFLNPDTIVTPEALCAARLRMREDPSCGAVGMRLINANGEFLPESKRGFPDPFTSFCKITKLYRLFPSWQRLNRYYLSWLPEDESHVVDILPGAFMYVRRTEQLDREGYFDERFFMYGEDIDLSARIARTHKNVYLPEPILHYKGESTNHESQHYVRVFYEAMQLFQQKYYPRRHILNTMLKVGIRLIFSISALRRKIFPSVTRENRVTKMCLFCAEYTKPSLKKMIPPLLLNGVEWWRACSVEALSQQALYCVEKMPSVCLVFDTTCYTYSEILHMWVDKKFLHTAMMAFYSPVRDAIVTPGECFTGKF